MTFWLEPREEEKNESFHYFVISNVNESENGQKTEAPGEGKGQSKGEGGEGKREGGEGSGSIAGNRGPGAQGFRTPAGLPAAVSCRLWDFNDGAIVALGGACLAL